MNVIQTFIICLLCVSIVVLGSAIGDIAKRVYEIEQKQAGNR